MATMTREEFRALVSGKADADLLAATKGREDEVLEGIFGQMPDAFDAAKAGNQAAVFQYDIDTPAGLRQWQVIVEGGKCVCKKDTSAKAKCTLKLNMANFMRMMIGELDGNKAFMSGQLKISGDVMFSRNLMVWFKIK